LRKKLYYDYLLLVARAKEFNTINLFLMKIALNPDFIHVDDKIARYTLPCTGERSREGLKKGDAIRKDQDGERPIR